VDICRNAHRVCVLVEVMEDLRGGGGNERRVGGGE